MLEKAFGITTQHALICAGDTAIAYLPYQKTHFGPAIAHCSPGIIYRESIEPRVEFARFIAEKFPSAYVDSSKGENSSTSTFNLRLEESYDEYWNSRVHSKARYDVRKAAKHELRTEFLCDDAESIFYDLYLKRMRELGSPPLRLQFFSKMHEIFERDFCFAISFVGNKPVAASTLLMHNARWIAHPWSVSDSDFRHASVNYGHYNDLIKYAFDNEFENFYLGTSAKDSNWCRIKRRFGATEAYAVRADGGRDQHAAEKPLVKAAQRVIRNMPFSLYRRIGPSLGDLAIRLLG